MDLVRIVCSTALGLRKSHQLRVRLPLASLTIAHPAAESLAPFTGLIGEEVNVKAVELSAEPATLGRFELAVNPRVLGPRLGGQVQQVIRAVKAGSWTQAGDRVEAAGVVLEPGEYELKLAAADPDSTSALPGQAGLIALDLRVTPELAAEGTARDVVRVVQQARRDAGLAVSDRIRLTIGADGAVADAVRAHAGFVAAETLAVDLAVHPSAEVGGEPQPVADAPVSVALAACRPTPGVPAADDQHGGDHDDHEAERAGDHRQGDRARGDAGRRGPGRLRRAGVAFRGQDRGDRPDRVDHAVPGAGARRAARGGLDPRHHLGRAQSRVSRADQRDHPGHEGGGEAGAVLHRGVGVGEGTRVSAGHVHAGRRDRDRGVPVGEAASAPPGPTAPTASTPG